MQHAPHTAKHGVVAARGGHDKTRFRGRRMRLVEPKLGSKYQQILFAECYNFDGFEEYAEVTEP